MNLLQFSINSGVDTKRLCTKLISSWKSLIDATHSKSPMAASVVKPVDIPIKKRPRYDTSSTRCYALSHAFIISETIANEPGQGGRRPSAGDDEHRKDSHPPSSSIIDQPTPVLVSSRPTEATVPSTDADRPVNKRVAAETKELFDDFFATKKKKPMSLKPDCAFPVCRTNYGLTRFKIFKPMPRRRRSSWQMTLTSLHDLIEIVRLRQGCLSSIRIFSHR